MAENGILSEIDGGSEVHRLRAENDELLMRLECFETEAVEKAAENRGLKELAERFEQEKNRAADDNRRLKQAAERAKTEKSRLSEKLVDKETALRARTSELAAERGESERLRAELEKLRSERLPLERENERLKSALESSKAAEKRLRADISESDASRKRELEGFAREAAALRSGAAGLAEKLRGELSGILERFSLGLEREIGGLRSEIDRTGFVRLAKAYAELTKTFFALAEKTWHSDTDERLTAVCGELKGLRESFRDALARCGIVAVEPRLGDSFNPLFHIAPGARSGDRIVAVKSDGAALVGDDADNGSVLVKASVEVAVGSGETKRGVAFGDGFDEYESEEL